ncbi:MAG: L,D-transpeptidase [Hyphomicrobiaceae bacterium]|nr:L,D-transpeptidase [Hyphomicrobiaceae bacterium]
MSLVSRTYRPSRGLVIAAGLLVGLMSPAVADVSWEDGQPRFKSGRQGPNSYSSGSPFALGFPLEPTRPRYRSPELASGGPRPEIVASAPAAVRRETREVPGTVLIDTASRRLYYVIDDVTVYEYPIAVGREGFSWTGVETISRVQEWPDWFPPPEMRERDPRLPIKMTGGLRNPLGAKALYLGNTLYRIHGTNDTTSIGSASSSGCFRMRNEDVAHLASVVTIGATVKVLGSLPPPVPAPHPVRVSSAGDQARGGDLAGREPGTARALVPSPHLVRVGVTGETIVAPPPRRLR